ncbi:MAG: metallophosphoesterase family protein [Candidatus Hodarchaeales archaeon]
MFSLGIISDIHSNFEALKSVIDDLKVNFPDIKEIFCLGDVVGYGPEPKKCLDLLFREEIVSKVVKGNHDDYVARHSTPPQVNPEAKIAIDFQIRNTPLELRWELEHLPHSVNTKLAGSQKEIMMVHGSPQYPLTEYIYPNTIKQENLFHYMNKLDVDILALGHTHIPFIEKKKSGDGLRDMLMINPGAVGQPRDNDPRASYAVIDIKNLCGKIQRIEYDISKVNTQIKGVGLPEDLGSRLFRGN